MSVCRAYGCGVRAYVAEGVQLLTVGSFVAQKLLQQMSRFISWNAYANQRRT